MISPMMRMKGKRDNILQNKKKSFPHEMTFKELIIYIVFSILIGLFFYFIRGDTAGKLGALIVCPMIILYMIYAYRKEKKADNTAVKENDRIISGEYFNSPEWHMKYVAYINEHSFEKPQIPNMKKDLLKRFRRRDCLFRMVFMLFLMFCVGCAFTMGEYIIPAIGMIIFGWIFYMELSEYIGMPVRKWLRGDINYKVLEGSYLNSRMVTYKKNGLALGTTHIHAFTDKKIYAIDYRLVTGITRKVVRLKKYEDGIYSSEEYKHFAVIHVRLPRSGEIHDVEIELNEFQVQMVIDKLGTYVLGEMKEGISLTEDKENENVM